MGFLDDQFGFGGIGFEPQGGIFSGDRGSLLGQIIQGGITLGQTALGGGFQQLPAPPDITTGITGPGRRARRMVCRIDKCTGQQIFVPAPRRMNVLNPRALRRAMRRVTGFAHFAKKTISFTHRVRMKKHRFGGRRRKRIAA